ncbi:MAG: CoA transferase [Betaproteobacteria bacterium]|nr:CoA transferase [Betaproteobacteria bacterium]
MGERTPEHGATGASPSTAVEGALSGVRVLDLSRVLAGPICGQILADLGAEVIKVERPRVGDDSRAWGPPFALDPAGEPTAESAFYCACNRGKRSITVDLGKPEGREVIRKLAATSDVLLENYKVGTLERYGLGYEALSAINPGLVYCSITGFGQTGPYASRPGYDTIIQALGGIMSVTGQKDDAPGGGPVRVGIAVTDFMTGLYGAIAVQAALAYRARTGAGQHIDLSLLDVQISSLTNVAMNYLMSGEVPVRRGNRLPTVYPSDAYRCSDGYVMIIIGNDGQFRKFCAAAGLDTLGDDPRFLTNALRLKNADTLSVLMNGALSGRPIGEWLERFEKANVPCSPIKNIAEVFDDPHVKSRGARIELEHPVTGTMPGIANPMRFSKSPVAYDRAPPLLGQHTNEVLAEVLGMSESEIAALREAGAL